jgi:hypothetical protein
MYVRGRSGDIVSERFHMGYGTRWLIKRVRYGMNLLFINGRTHEMDRGLKFGENGRECSGEGVVSASRKIHKELAASSILQIIRCASVLFDG